MSKPEDGGMDIKPCDKAYCDKHGLSKREAYAMAAMQGILAGSTQWVSPHDFNEIAKRSCGMADAMIAMLKAGGE